VGRNTVSPKIRARLLTWSEQTAAVSLYSSSSQTKGGYLQADTLAQDQGVEIGALTLLASLRSSNSLPPAARKMLMEHSAMLTCRGTNATSGRLRQCRPHSFQTDAKRLRTITGACRLQSTVRETEMKTVSCAAGSLARFKGSRMQANQQAQRQEAELKLKCRLL
jgi:hypothetical protein